MREWMSDYAYFVIPLFSWLIAQIAKILIKGITESNWNWRYIYRSGGMPSAHTTIVVSLCTVVGVRLGTHAPEFGIACTLAAIVMYDAINVRHAVGEHAVAIRALLPAVFKKDAPAIPIHQSYGHTPLEVLAGLVIGVIVPILVFIVT
jgi:acid phosphatase family membrane protein YuiD